MESFFALLQKTSWTADPGAAVRNCASRSSPGSSGPTTGGDGKPLSAGRPVDYQPVTTYCNYLPGPGRPRPQLPDRHAHRKRPDRPRWLFASATIDLASVIGRAVFAAPLSARRDRSSARLVKRAIVSKHRAKGPRPQHLQTAVTIPA